jgi:hypothetical protein
MPQNGLVLVVEARAMWRIEHVVDHLVDDMFTPLSFHPDKHFGIDQRTECMHLNGWM